jgi:hypothetical protein
MSTMVTWRVGDAVLVHPNDSGGASTAIMGHIVEIKRGGWYTIRTAVMDGLKDETTIKCRAKNLTRCPHNSNDTAASTLPPVTAALVPSNQEIQAAMGSTDVLATTTVPAVGQNDTLNVATAETIQTTALSRVPTTVPATANVAAAVAPFFPHVTTSQDAPELPIVAPPPPTMIDLDELLRVPQGALSLSAEYIQQLEYFATFRQWVVFTDLHCSSATLDTCRQVLQIVHDQAV